MANEIRKQFPLQRCRNALSSVLVANDPAAGVHGALQHVQTILGVSTVSFGSQTVLEGVSDAAEWCWPWAKYGSGYLGDCTRLEHAKGASAVLPMPASPAEELTFLYAGLSC